MRTQSVLLQRNDTKFFQFAHHEDVHDTLEERYHKIQKFSTQT